MNGLGRASTDQLVAELSRRGALPRCQCQRWSTYVGVWDSDGATLRCYGCKRATRRCMCR